MRKAIVAAAQAGGKSHPLAVDKSDSSKPSPQPPDHVYERIGLHDRVLWFLDDVAAVTGFSRSALERERAAGRFPEPDVKLGKRPSWKPSTIRDWIDASAAGRRGAR